MFQNATPKVWHFLLQILQWLGLSSLAGLLALYTAWLGLRPELLIEAVADKSKKFSSESRIRIKNSGKLPAVDLRAEVKDFRAKTVEAGDKILTVTWMTDGPRVASRLSGGESSDIPISPGVNFMSAAQISECSYNLTLVYHAKLLWLRKEFRKAWRVELRTFEDGFSWNIELA